MTSSLNRISTGFIGLSNDENIGHSGYVHLSTDQGVEELELSGCQILDVNKSTCNFPSRSAKPDYNTLAVLRAWAAITIHNNILSFLGSLLHQKNSLFIADTYTALKIVYEEFRKNNVKIMDFLPKLPVLAMLPYVKQHTAVLKVLKDYAPPFCKCPLEIIIAAVSKIQWDINSDIDDTVDLFANVGLQFNNYFIRTPSYQRFDTNIAAELGKEFAIYFAAIQDSKIKLTQPVLASLILNMKFNEIEPDIHEDFRFLMDALRNSKIPNWIPGFTGSPNINDPYVLVTKMMTAIVKHEKTDISLKKIASRLKKVLTKVLKPNETTSYQELYAKAKLNIDLLFDIIEKMIPGPQTQLVRLWAENNSINLNYALKGFNRYLYETPEKMAFAFIRRIAIRVPMDLNQHEVFRLIIADLNRVKPINCPNLRINEDQQHHFDNHSVEKHYHQHPPIEKNISHAHNTHLLTKGHVAPKFHPPSPPTAVHSHPSIPKQHYPKSEIPAAKSIINNKKRSLPHGFLNNETSSIKTSISQTICDDNDCVSSIVNKFTKTNENRTHLTSKCPKEPPPPSLSSWLRSLDASATNTTATSVITNASTVLYIFMNKSNIENLINRINATTPKLKPEDKNNLTKLASVETKKNLLKRILKEMLSIKKVRARRVVYYEVIRIYCILIHVPFETTPNLTRIKLEEPPTNKIIENIANIVSENFKKVIKNYFLIYNSSIRPNRYRTNRYFLVDLFEELLTIDFVKRDDVLFDEIINLLQIIEDYPINISEFFSLGIITDNTLERFNGVHRRLQRSLLCWGLGADFDLGRYPTKGRLFIAILRKLMNNSQIKKNKALLKFIKHQITKVICTGPGDESMNPIFYGIRTDQINFREVLASGLDKTKVTPAVAEAFANMFNWYGENFTTLWRMQTPDTNDFDTRSDFLKDLLDDFTDKLREDHEKMSKEFEQTIREFKHIRDSISRTSSALDSLDLSTVLDH